MQVRAHTIVRRDRIRLLQFPRAGRITIGLRGQGPHWTQIDHIAREFRHHRLRDIGADFHIFAAPGRPEFAQSCHFFAEAHTARAMNAARHVGLHQRTDILIAHHALPFGELRDGAAIAEREILQFALTALIADWAIERMVDQQKFHRRLLSRDRLGRFGVHLHAVHHRRRTGGLQLRRALHFDQAHAAIGGDRELFVIAEARNINSGLIGDVDQHRALARLHRLPVDFNRD